MSKKKGKVAAPARVPQAPPEATHFAVPLVVFQATLKVLETLPFSQVSPLMGALQQCQPLAVPGGAGPGAMVPGLKKDQGNELKG